MDDKKRKLRRYSITVLIGGVVVGFLLALAWAFVAAVGVSRHIHWITRLGTDGRKAVAQGLVLASLLAGAFLIARAKKRLFGDKIAAQESEDKRQFTEEKSGVGWKVPKSAEAADWPKVVVFTVVIYFVTFIAMGIICGVVELIDWLIPSRRQLDKDMTALHAAFICANFIGVMIPSLFVLMLAVFPRVKVTLISDGVLRRMGGIKKLIPYATIEKVCIIPSRRRPSLKCFAIMTNERGYSRWHRFEFGKNTDVDEITKVFESKGFPVEIVETPGGEKV